MKDEREIRRMERGLAVGITVWKGKREKRGALLRITSFFRRKRILEEAIRPARGLMVN